MNIVRIVKPIGYLRECIRPSDSAVADNDVDVVNAIEGTVK
jgi:hypothetical protein